MPRIVLLGTGMPVPNPARRGPAQVVEAEGESILIDCGAGTLHRLVEAGVDVRRLRRIALTHLHSDHITGLPDLLWGGALDAWWTRPPGVIGPPGTRDFLTRLVEAFHYDLKVRAYGHGHVLPDVTEVEDAWTADLDPFRLTAFRVDHAPVDQAFGYRLDVDAHSVVVSGDTCRSEKLIRSARGVDVLVHEVISRPGMEAIIAADTDEAKRQLHRQILAYHTPADELGDIATRAQARHLVLSHIVSPKREPNDLVGAASRGYEGRVTLGEDLMSIGLNAADR